MSRNKLIKWVHETTGKKYAECRIICKAGKWDEQTVVCLTLVGSTNTDELFNTICNICGGVFDLMSNVFDSLGKAAAGAAQSFRIMGDSLEASQRDNMIKAAAMIAAKNREKNARVDGA